MERRVRRRGADIPAHARMKPAMLWHPVAGHLAAASAQVMKQWRRVSQNRPKKKQCFSARQGGDPLISPETQVPTVHERNRRPT